MIFCDTDLITIKIWSDYKYQKCDDWITQKINSQKKEKRIYILCKPDLPWEYDPQRKNKDSRDELFNTYKKELIKIKKCSKFGKNFGLEIHAGHGLDYKTTAILTKIKEITEFNIGHFIIGESVTHGLKKTIKSFRKIINK